MAQSAAQTEAPAETAAPTRTIVPPRLVTYVPAPFPPTELAAGRGAVVLQPRPDHRGPPGRVVAGNDGYAQAKPVQQLGPEFPLLRVHGADQQEP